MSCGIGSQVFEYGSIARVLFGIGAREQVGVEARNLTGGTNCLIITDPGVTKAHLTDEIVESLKREGFSVSICDKVEPEPSISAYKAVLEVAKKENPDVIVGIGGGSSLDTSKTVARALINPGALEEFINKEFPKPGVPLITIPTTAGTAAEVTPDSVIRLPDEKVKSCFYNTRATVAIVDPVMTLTLPKKLTAATGIDALSHAIESALSKMATPLTEALALESIRLISENLRVATFEGTNLEARKNMAWATLIEGFSESNAGDVEAHAVAHVLGGYYKVHHGEACAIALPYCMKYNLPVNVPILARIAKAMDQSISGTPRDMAEKGIYSVYELIREVGVSTSISQIEKASKDDIPDLVHLYRTNPNITTIFFDNFIKRGVPTEIEATEFFEEMFEPVFELPRRRSVE